MLSPVIAIGVSDQLDLALLYLKNTVLQTLPLANHCACKDYLIYGIASGD